MGWEEEGGWGGGGGEEGSPGQRQFPVFEHTKISESAQRNRIYSKQGVIQNYSPK